MKPIYVITIFAAISFGCGAASAQSAHEDRLEIYESNGFRPVCHWNKVIPSEREILSGQKSFIGKDISLYNDDDITKLLRWSEQYCSDTAPIGDYQQAAETLRSASAFALNPASSAAAMQQYALQEQLATLKSLTTQIENADRILNEGADTKLDNDKERIPMKEPVIIPPPGVSVLRKTPVGSGRWEIEVLHPGRPGLNERYKFTVGEGTSSYIAGKDRFKVEW